MFRRGRRDGRARSGVIVLAAAVVPLLCVLAYALTGSYGAALVAAACALTFRMFFVEAATGFRPQLFMMFFAVAALVAHARGRLAVGGALAACAFLCWQPAAVVGAALLIAVLFGGASDPECSAHGAGRARGDIRLRGLLRVERSAGRAALSVVPDGPRAQGPAARTHVELPVARRSERSRPAARRRLRGRVAGRAWPACGCGRSWARAGRGRRGGEARAGAPS